MNLKLLSPLVLLLFSFDLHSQSNKEKYDTLKYTDQVIIVPDSLEVREIDLDHPRKPNYNGKIKTTLYFQDKTKVDTSILNYCYLNECVKSVTSEPFENRINSTSLASTENPFIIQPRKKMRAGVYYLAVKDSAGNPLHMWSIPIIGKIPKIHNIQILQSNNLVDSLEIPFNYNLSNTKIRLLGENLDQSFENVSIQGLSLKKVSEQTYAFSSDWNKANLSKIHLGNPTLKIKRYNSNVEDSKTVKIRGPKPVIETNSPIPINPASNSIEVDIPVSNIFQDTKILIENLKGKSVLRQGAEFQISGLKRNDNSIKVELNLNSNAFANGSAKFKATLLNGDGQASDTTTISLTVNGNLVNIQPLDPENYPLLEGQKVPVILNRINGGAFQKEKLLIIDVKGKIDTLDIKNDFDVANKVVTDVEVPKDSGGSLVSFKLSNDGNVWLGSFPSILVTPNIVIEEKTDVILPSRKLTLRSDKQSSAIKIIPKNKPPGISLSATDFKTGIIEIKADASTEVGKKFSLLISQSSYSIDTMHFSVGDWPTAKKAFVVKYLKGLDSLNNQKKLITTENDLITLFGKNQASNLPLNSYSYYLRRRDGSELSTRKYLTKSDSATFGRIIDLRANGLFGGKEFSLNVVDPKGLEYSQPFYVKRKWQERIVVQAGLSAINHYIGKKRNEVLEQTNVLSGVNLGVFYLPDWQKNESKRWLGFGLSFIGQEGVIETDQNGNRTVNTPAGLRFGAGILIYETLSIGIATGEGLPRSIFVGANVTFLDLSNLIQIKKKE